MGGGGGLGGVTTIGALTMVMSLGLIPRLVARASSILPSVSLVEAPSSLAEPSFVTVTSASTALVPTEDAMRATPSSLANAVLSTVGATMLDMELVSTVCVAVNDGSESARRDSAGRARAARRRRVVPATTVQPAGVGSPQMVVDRAAATSAVVLSVGMVTTIVVTRLTMTTTVVLSSGVLPPTAALSSAVTRLEAGVELIAFRSRATTEMVSNASGANGGGRDGSDGEDGGGREPRSSGVGEGGGTGD